MISENFISLNERQLGVIFALINQKERNFPFLLIDRTFSFFFNERKKVPIGEFNVLLKCIGESLQKRRSIKIKIGAVNFESFLRFCSREIRQRQKKLRLKDIDTQIIRVKDII